jgi:hypothetical protein
MEGQGGGKGSEAQWAQATISRLSLGRHGSSIR